MTKEVVTAIDAQVAATRAMYDAILTLGHEDTGIRNKNGEEPGVTLVNDVEFQVRNRLNFLHTNFANRKDWAENSVQRANTAERLKLEVEGIQNQLDKKTARDGGPAGTGVAVSEFESVFTNWLIAERYAIIGTVRWEQMNREYSMLLELYEEMMGKEFVPTTVKSGNKPGATVIDPEALKKAMNA